jgi:exopolysaccharide/PEP-CTERM locus tyrosine autokinase
VSKIEKALNKARTTGALRVVSTQMQRAEKETPTENLPTVVSTTSLIEQRGRSSESIARMKEKSLLDKQTLARNQIIYPEMEETGTVRSFRELRTKIIQKTQGRNCVIMVTSVVSGGGSSFVAMNLGVAFAFDAGKTALLMDCNLKNPSLHRLFGAGTFRGLTDYMDNTGVDIAEIIHPVGIERLRIIPSGGRREIPSEYFTSFKMNQLLESIKQRYRERYIILDAPPMTESADTQILAEACDYVLLVVPYGRVTDSQVTACAKAISDKKLLGIIFNNEPSPPALRWRRILNPFVALWEILFHPVRNNPKLAK